eukprot:4202270-Pyramimonas_sp.AAC.1
MPSYLSFPPHSLLLALLRHLPPSPRSLPPPVRRSTWRPARVLLEGALGDGIGGGGLILPTH